jgi:hypothetical protein
LAYRVHKADCEDVLTAPYGVFELA